MKYVIILLLLIPSISYAQPVPQTQQRSAESYRLELQLADTGWKQCRVNLADVWEQGNTLQKKNEELEAENKKLKDIQEKAKIDKPQDSEVQYEEN